MMVICFVRFVFKLAFSSILLIIVPATARFKTVASFSKIPIARPSTLTSLWLFHSWALSIANFEKVLLDLLLVNWQIFQIFPCSLLLMITILQYELLAISRNGHGLKEWYHANMKQIIWSYLVICFEHTSLRNFLARVK